MVQSSSEMLKPLISFDDIKKTHPDHVDMVNYERYAIIYKGFSLDLRVVCYVVATTRVECSLRFLPHLVRSSPCSFLPPQLLSAYFSPPSFFLFRSFASSPHVLPTSFLSLLSPFSPPSLPHLSPRYQHLAEKIDMYMGYRLGVSLDPSVMDMKGAWYVDEHHI
jgi:hypothetical protein